MTVAPGTTDPTGGSHGDDLVARVDGLQRAVVALGELLPDDALTAARSITDRATERLRLSGEHTIVALAGATGSGKSSLFNILTDLEIAGVGSRRPTTSWALACAWGPEGASEILEWIGIPARHQVSRTSMLDTSSDDTNLRGLVLLDLPDHDSTEVSHHLEVDRLVEYADLLVWVLDPQKYADAAIHERYLKPLSSHAEVTLVVLNQIDTVDPALRESTLADVHRLLVDDGMADPVVLPTSAATGQGIDDLKRALVTRIREKQSARRRLLADLEPVAAELERLSGSQRTPHVSDADRAGLERIVAESAGVPVVVETLRSETTRLTRRATAWPPARLAGVGGAPARAAVGAPEHASSQRGVVAGAVQDLADRVSSGLTRPWASAVRARSVGRADALSDNLDSALAGAQVTSPKAPGWATAVGVLQWLLLLGALAGLGWWIYDLVTDSTTAPEVAGWSVGLLAGAGCLALGLVLWLVGAVAAGPAGRRRAAEASESLGRAVSDVTQVSVIEPIEAVLSDHETARDGLARALGGR